MDTLQSIGLDAIAREIASKHGLTIDLVSQILNEDLKLTMKYLSEGFRVIKKNAYSFSVRELPEKKFVSALNKKEYLVPQRLRVRVKIGDGLVQYLNNTVNIKNEPLSKFTKRTDVQKS